VAGGSGSGALRWWEGEEMVRHIGLEAGVAGDWSSPWGGQGSSSRSSTDGSRREGEGVGVLGWLGFERGRKMGVTGSRGRGPGGGRWPRSRRGLRERERGGCLVPTDGWRPVGSGPRPTFTGGVAWPCCVTGPSRGGGGRLTGGAPTQLRVAAVELV
jgi:hypothetical protein